MPPLLLLLACTGVDGAAAPTDPAPAVPAARPNFLVIDIDSLRADRVTLARDGAPVAPTLARLAREGRHYRAARSQSAWTLPAAWSLVTGRHPLLIEVRDDTLPRWGGGERTLPGILGLYGYRTAAWWGRTILADGGAHAMGFGEEFTLSRDDYTLPLADWIGAGGDAPFFAFVHNLDLHLPAPAFPADALHAYTPAVPGCPGRSPTSDFDALAPRIGVEAARAHVVAHYDAQVHAYDAVVADLLRQLDEAGVGGSTVVVVTSDHGEELFERGAIRHGVHHAPVLDVPLLVFDPEGPPGPVDTPVQTIDLAPSVLARAGIPLDAAMEGRPWTAGGPEREVWSISNRENASVTTPTHHVLRRAAETSGGPTAACHDRAADPAEAHSLPVDEAPCSELLARLDRWIAERLGATAAVPRDPLDPEQKRLLQERGYWDLAHPDPAPTEAPARPARRKPRGGG